MRRPAAVAVLVAVTLALTGCGLFGDEPAGSGPTGPEPTETTAEPTASATPATFGDPTSVVAGDDAAGLALATSKAVFRTAPAVVLAAPDDLPGQAAAASVAVVTGLPLLLAAPRDTRIDDEIERLGATTALAVGEGLRQWSDDEIDVVAAPADAAGLSEVTGRDFVATDPTSVNGLPAALAAVDPAETHVLSVPPDDGATDSPTDDSTDRPTGPAAPAIPWPRTVPPRPDASLLVLVTPDVEGIAPAATARAAGALVQVARGADPRASEAAVTAIADRRPDHVLAAGVGIADEETLARRVEVAATGAQLPGGGQLALQDRTMVALYGHPDTPSLGVLGEQDVAASIDRATELAGEYADLVDGPVVPAFELIATVASAEPGGDGDYSAVTSVAELRPWVDAAAAAGVYVVLDLQPGRTDFLTQARRYEELLSEPHVGLALDPEWRLTEDQTHLKQIGSVGADEVNQVVTWLAELTARDQLPQKVLLLHQFRLSMLRDRDAVDTSRDELAVLVHADGNGTRAQKLSTYEALTAGAGDDLVWGWKNFLDEDDPTFTPAETMAVEPRPVFVSYQ